MKHSIGLITVLALAATLAAAQDDPKPELTPRVMPAQTAASSAPAQPPLTVPAGTKVPLTLKQGITTKNAREGDPVYAETAFPVTQDNQIVIPAGTYVQGKILSVVRPGRVKGRAELQMSFTSMIFPNGYTIALPATVDNTPGSQNTQMKGQEGTIQGQGGKGKDAQTIAGMAMPGAGIGAIAGGGKGAAIGGAAGSAVGLATVLLSRGPEIQLDTGSSLEMILERPIDIDAAKVHKVPGMN